MSAQANELPSDLVDHGVVINAQTMANDGDSPAVLRMGSDSEIALFVLVD